MKPAGLPSEVTAAVCTSPINSMRTAPRGIVDNLDFLSRRAQAPIILVIGRLRQPFPVELIHGECQCHLTEAMMVAIRCTVRGQMDELGNLGIGSESGHEVFDEALSAIQQPLECYLASERRMVKE